MLSLFDSDLDFKSNRVRLWQPGTIAELAESEGLVEVPAAVLNESGVVRRKQLSTELVSLCHLLNTLLGVTMSDGTNTSVAMPLHATRELFLIQQYVPAEEIACMCIS
jgi:hypothetical protein